MRLLFTSFPAFGHVHPMVPLALAAMAEGDEVLWATGPDLVEWVAACGVPAAAAGLDYVTQAREARQRFDGPLRAAHLFTSVAVPPMVTDLLELLNRWPADLIVHEEAEYAAPLVAELLGIPCVTHSWAAPARPSEERNRSLGLLEAIWADRGAGAPRVFGSRYLDACPPPFQTEAVRAIPAVQPIRPVPFDGPTTASPAWLSDLRRPAAYVSFGTIPQFSRPEVLQSTLHTVAKIVAATVVTTGPNPTDCLDVAGMSVFVEQYLSQSVVLPHVDVVVSHGGAGTTLGALMHGLPHVVLPQQPWSQKRNAERIAELGIGVHVAEQSADQLRGAVDAVLMDPQYAEATVRMRDILLDLPSPDVVVSQLRKDLA